MRRWKLCFLVIMMAVCVLSLPSAALAGGWAVVSLDALPEEFVAGEEVAVGFTVLQHGHRPMANLTPTVKLLHPASGDRTTVAALPVGPAGHYVAQVSFPRAGTWEWAIEAFTGDHPMPPLTVRPAAGSAASPATGPAEAMVSPSALPAAWRWPTLAGGAGLVALGLALIGLGRRSRRPAGAAAAS